MKNPFILFLSIIASPLCTAEPLKDADREAILEKLEDIRKGAESSADSRIRTAVSAFRKAIASDSAAIDLYLECEEKVNFTDMKKKAADFREWRKRNSEMLGDAAYKHALRQQLRWLLLTMEAASEEPDKAKLASEAQTILQSIISQSNTLQPYRNVLEQNVTATVFARAYNLTGIKVENWPLSPLAVSDIYEQILLPPLRNPAKIKELSLAWEQRIACETKLISEWSNNSPKQKNGEQSPQLDKFIINTLPNLQWQAEIDLFSAGDQRAASIRMLKHISDHISHENAKKWTDQLESLLTNNSTPPQP